MILKLDHLLKLLFYCYNKIIFLELKISYKILNFKLFIEEIT